MRSNKQKGATKLVNCGQASIPSDLWLVQSLGGMQPRKAREKKQPTQPTPEIKWKKMKKPELIGLKLIGLSGWNILFLNIIQSSE